MPKIKNKLKKKFKAQEDPILKEKIRRSKPTRCPSTCEWIMKMWYRDTVKLYPALRKAEIMRFPGENGIERGDL